ncbi:MAG: PepSY-like domain-containing protein [Acidobacteriota bacterium]
MHARVSVATIVALVVIASSIASAQAARKAAPKVPPAIATAFKAAYPNATIKGVSREKYAGKDAYEVESVENGRSRDLIYRLDGTVAVVEEELADADVPAAVAAAVKTDFPQATVTKYERSIEKGVTSYEVALKGAKVKEAQYTEAGKRK